jgi:hypothetical protein
MLTKEKGDYTIRFLPNTKKQKEDNFMLALQDLKYLVSKYMLDGDVEMFIIDQDFNEVEDIKMTSDERKAYFDSLIKGEPQQNANQYTNNQYPSVDSLTTSDDIEGGGY